MSDKIWTNRTFVLLFVASALAISGLSMLLTTLSWYVIRDLDRPSMLGVVLVSITVPRLIMMLFGGMLADKYKKTTIMFGTNLLQGAVLFVMFLLLITDQMTILYMCILGGLFGILDAFFGPASSSMIPKIISKHKLQKANAYFQGVDQIAFIIGPLMAGLIMEFYSVNVSVFVAFLIVLFSAIFVFPPLIKEGPVENDIKQNPLEDMIEGLKYVRHSKFLIISILVLITLNFFTFGSLQIAMAIIVDMFGGSPIHLSYMEIAISSGMLFGIFILGRFDVKYKGRVAIYGLFGALLSYMIIGFANSLTVVIIVLLVVGFAMSFVYIPLFAAAQQVTESRMMGRVMAIIFLAMNGFDPIAYSVVSFLVAIPIHIQTIIISFSIIGLIIAFVLFISGREFMKKDTLSA